MNSHSLINEPSVSREERREGKRARSRVGGKNAKTEKRHIQEPVWAEFRKPRRYIVVGGVLVRARARCSRESLCRKASKPREFSFYRPAATRYIHIHRRAPAWRRQRARKRQRGRWLSKRQGASENLLLISTTRTRVFALGERAGAIYNLLARVRGKRDELSRGARLHVAAYIPTSFRPRHLSPIILYRERGKKSVCALMRVRHTRREHAFTRGFRCAKLIHQTRRCKWERQAPLGYFEVKLLGDDEKDEIAATALSSFEQMADVGKSAASGRHSLSLEATPPFPRVSRD